MRTLLCISLLVACMAASAQAAQLWAAWELALGDHEPPKEFVLTVTSPSGAVVPPALHIPWASCTTVPGAQHCALLGCPPAGIYEFQVHAVYADGDSAPSNLARCTLQRSVCQCAGAFLAVPPPWVSTPPIAVPPVAKVAVPPPPAIIPPLSDDAPTLVETVPPLVQPSAHGLGLQPVGDIPPMPTWPKPPACKWLCDWLKK